VRPLVVLAQLIQDFFSLHVKSVWVLRSRCPLSSSTTFIMASSLAGQLSQIAAKSTNALNLKAQKAAHSKSLIFEPRVAASQSFDTIYTLCHEGFQELCLLDGRFLEFQRNIFSEQSQAEDRTQMTADENSELDKRLESFLGLVGGRLRLSPAIKAVEWLVRRFRYVLEPSQL
jgi:U3 small nucleolar RNA-associated protein 10